MEANISKEPGVQVDLDHQTPALMSEPGSSPTSLQNLARTSRPDCVRLGEALSWIRLVVHAGLTANLFINNTL